MTSTNGTTARAIRLSDELWDKAGRRARAEGRDRSQIARDALDDYVESVELWEDSGGGLHLVANDVGYHLADGATSRGFCWDAAGWYDNDWDPAHELESRPGWGEFIESEFADGVGAGDRTQHVATWTRCGLFIPHDARPGGAASGYLGIDFD